MTHKTDSLIDIMGGIDNILTIVLSSTDFQPTQQDLLQLHQTITTFDNIHADIQNNVEMSQSDQKWTHYFSCTDTFLHSIFGDKDGQKILKAIYSQYSLIIPLLISAGIFIQFVLETRRIAVFILFGIINAFLVTWVILILLSANKF